MGQGITFGLGNKGNNSSLKDKPFKIESGSPD